MHTEASDSASKLPQLKSCKVSGRDRIAIDFDSETIKNVKSNFQFKDSQFLKAY